jgi:hypothetical protein
MCNWNTINLPDSFRDRHLEPLVADAEKAAGRPVSSPASQTKTRRISCSRKSPDGRHTEAHRSHSTGIRARCAASRGIGGKATTFGRRAIGTRACEPMELRSAGRSLAQVHRPSSRREEELTVDLPSQFTWVSASPLESGKILSRFTSEGKMESKKAQYVLRYYGHLMTTQERLAQRHLIGRTPATAMKLGKQPFGCLANSLKHAASPRMNR